MKFRFNFRNIRIMRKKKISVLEWESMINTISILRQENAYLDVLALDSMQSMGDTAKQREEELAIKAKYDSVYYSRK